MKTLLLIVIRVLTLCLLWGASVSFFFDSQPASSVVVACDISKSIPEDISVRLSNQAEILKNFPSKEFVGFAEKAVYGSTFTTPQNLSSLLNQKEKNKTNLEAALRMSLSANPGAILLFSDGNENIGETSNIFGLIEAKKIPIYVFADEIHSLPKDMHISQFQVPLVTKPGKPAEVRASIMNPQGKPQNAHIVVKHADRIILEKDIELQGNQETLLITESDTKILGRNPVQLTLSYQNSSGPHLETKTVFLSSERPDSVLLLSGSVVDDRFLSTVFKEKSYQVVSEIVQQTSVLNLDEHQVVILNNVPKENLPSNFQSLLKKFVESGKGLVVIGGDKSFGLGGYIGSEISELLPVELVPPQAEKKKLDLAVLLVIDKSESMSHESRIEFAKEAAKQVILNLKPSDYIGVIGFDLTPFVVVNIGRLSAVRDYALKQIQDLFPTRVTRLYPALIEAEAQLQGVKAGRKHMIVLTDGNLPDENELGAQYENLIREMRYTGITLSTVLIGEPRSGNFLRKLANIGGGAHYQTQDPSSLPRIFLHDMQVVSGEKTLKESALYEVITGPQGITSASISEFPPLRGYVETKPRQGARLELTARGSMAADPLLASWNYKSGRVIAFTSDCNGRWSSEWVPWTRFRQFWSEIIETARGSEGDKVKPPEFDVRPIFTDGKVKLDLVVYGSLKGATPKVFVTKPDLTKDEFGFLEQEPGHYVTSNWELTTGVYSANIVAGEMHFPEIAWNVDSSMLEESKERGINFELLNKLAELSGGKVNPKEEEIKPLKGKNKKMGDVDTRLAVYALLAFFTELIIRLGYRTFRL